MTRTRNLLALTGALAALVGLLAAAGPESRAHSDGALHQVGTYEYLTQPDFSGLAPVSAIAIGNTIGLGTFTDLDGELVMLGGEVYRVRPDGIPRIVPGDATTPFMQAVRFQPTRNTPVAPGTTCEQLPTLINQAAEQANGIVAVRVRGTFDELTTRSINADPAPYQPLSQTITEQTTFDLDGQRAALVGFWQGKDALGVGQDGLHLHGLTADRTAGGHVLSCTASSDVQLSIQPVTEVQLLTPAN